MEIIGERKDNHLKTTLSALKIGVKFIPIISIASVFLGLIYLYYYTNRFCVPFPLTLSALPSLLLIIAFLSTSILLIAISFVFLPVIVTFGGNKDSIINSIQRGGTNDSVISIYQKIVGYTIILILIIIYSSFFFLNILNITYILWPLYLYSQISTLIYCNKHYFTNNKFELSFLIIIINLFSFIWVIIVILFTSRYFPTFTKSPITVTFIFLLLSVAIWLFNFFQVTLKRKFIKNLSDPNVAIVLVAMIIFTPFFIPDIAVYLSKSSLRLLKIGGGYESILYLNPKTAKNLPSYLLEEKTDSLSRTKKMNILLNIGDNIYFKYHNKKQTFEIKKKFVILAEIKK